MVIILVFVSSCTENIFSTPYGNKTLEVDTLKYDHSITSSVKNMNVNAEGNKLYQNKVGRYNDLDTKFMIKFTNFAALSGLSDSIYATINNANIVLHVAGYWGDESDFSFDISMVDNDSSLYWTNISDVTEIFEEIEGQTTYYSTMTASTDADSLFIPLDTSLVNEWYASEDTFYVNNGFTVTKSNETDGLISFYSIDYASIDEDLIPRLKLECSLYDTNNTYLQDTTIYIVGGGDLQYALSTASVEDSLFYLSQGNIHRSFLEMDSLRQDTLLGPTDLMNRAMLSLVVDPLNTTIDLDDTTALYLTARLFKTDYWEEDSIQYLYTAYSSAFDENVDTVKIDISQLVQYLISTPKETEHEGLFFYLNNEYNDFNTLSIDPDKTELDIIHTKVRNE